MKRVITSIILSTLIVIFSFSNMVYAEEYTSELAIPGPKIEELKDRGSLVNSYNRIKLLRESLSILRIYSNTSEDELKAIYKSLDYYLIQLNSIEDDLETHMKTYSESFDDVYVAEVIKFIAESYNICIRGQQLLIKQMLDGNSESKSIFYSQYAATPYYYLALGDHMISYIDTYVKL